MRISDWSSDVCSSDLPCFWRPRQLTARPFHMEGAHKPVPDRPLAGLRFLLSRGPTGRRKTMAAPVVTMQNLIEAGAHFGHQTHRWNPRMKPYIFRSEEHTSELQSLMRISYAVFC